MYMLYVVKENHNPKRYREYLRSLMISTIYKMTEIENLDVFYDDLVYVFGDAMDEQKGNI